IAGLYSKLTCLLAIYRGLLDNIYLDNSNRNENKQVTELNLREEHTGLQKVLHLTLYKL
ncbi:hypothetical protein BO71DRAFT_403914, partial [Aspergillus ellipticus CBS 707.79]